MKNDPVISKLLALSDDDAFWEKRDAEVAELLELQRQKDIAARKARTEKQWLAIPDIYREPFDPSKSSLSREAITYCRKWKPSDGGIGLLGLTGLGKTRLLCAALRRFRESHSWLYLPAFEMSNYVAQQWDDNWGVSGPAERALRLAKKVDILILDDLGDERATDAASSYLKELVEHRTARKLPVLWSSNMTKEELSSRHGLKGDASVRRLMDFSTIF